MKTMTQMQAEINAEKAAQAAIENLIDESPNRAMSLLTGNFVGLLRAIVSENGGDPDEELMIDVGDSRDITIHARKAS